MKRTPLKRGKPLARKSRLSPRSPLHADVVERDLRARVAEVEAEARLGDELNENQRAYIERLQADRDAARAEVVRLREALRRLAYDTRDSDHVYCPVCSDFPSTCDELYGEECRGFIAPPRRPSRPTEGDAVIDDPRGGEVSLSDIPVVARPQCMTTKVVLGTMGEDRNRLSTLTLTRWAQEGWAMDAVHDWSCDGPVSPRGLWLRIHILLDDLELFDDAELHPDVRQWRSDTLMVLNLHCGGSVPRSTMTKETL